MTHSNYRIQTLLICMGIMLLLLVSGCKKENQDIQSWFNNVGRLRGLAQRESSSVPYLTPQHQALKSYFAEVGRMALSLQVDSELRQRFNAAVSQRNFQETCAQAFVPKSEWQVVMERCTQNRFFLCAEEVRAYPLMVSVFRDRLNADQRRRFEQTASCRAAL